MGQIIDGAYYGGIVGEKNRESDWVMGGNINWSQVKTPEHAYDDHEIQYNQNEYKRNGCTIYGSMGCYSDLRGHRFSYDWRVNCYDTAEVKGLNPNYGRYVPDAVHHVYELTGDVSYAMCSLGGNDFYKALDLGFSLLGGYGGNRTFNRDRDDNGIVESNNWGEATYHHAIRFKKSGGLYIVDNYYGRTTNVYSFPELEKKISESGEMFYWTYFYFDKIEINMATLPDHVTRDEAKNPSEKEIIIARENEVSARLEDGGEKEKLYRYYRGDHALERMLIDLKLIRLGVM